MRSLGSNSGVDNDVQELLEMTHIESIPIDEDEELDSLAMANTTDTLDGPVTGTTDTSLDPALPQIPPVPEKPKPIDLSIYTDKDSRKIAEKEQKRLERVYRQALKDRESAIKDRKKLVEKREKKAQQSRDKQIKADEKQRLKEEKEEEKRRATINPEPPRERQPSVASSSATAPQRPKKDRNFCMLPAKYDGQRDKCWIRVYMEGVDEVGAHCGLFLPGPHYENLVGDVGERVTAWVDEDAGRRAALDYA